METTEKGENKMNYSDIKENDLVCFNHIEEKSYGKDLFKTVKGYVLSNERNKILIRWFGIPKEYEFIKWNMSIIKYEDAESLNFMKLGVSKYPTLYRPAFFGFIGVHIFWYFFGSLITGVLGTISLGFGGAMAFILAKNFKRIKNFKIKKNVTILSPVKEEDKPEFITKPHIKNSELKMIKR